jgi:hypothetical protein
MAIQEKIMYFKSLYPPYLMHEHQSAFRHKAIGTRTATRHNYNVYSFGILIYYNYTQEHTRVNFFFF